MCAGCPGDLPQAVYAAVWMSCRRRDGSADRCGSLWQSVQRNLERRAETSATAIRFDSAMVKIDETFGNRESETKSAELSAYRRISLLKWLKQRSQPLRFNSNPCVGNFEMKTFTFVVKRADRDLSALRR